MQVYAASTQDETSNVKLWLGHDALRELAALADRPRLGNLPGYAEGHL